ncbi:thioesterase family protein [Neolewinella lacunae]|uniref:Acyl-CoA thioesterase n=1 Tax=Neolewinella lacunae TaxID=1517758 RepID=A0A923PMJ0_9BACT|nr:thioesterase family protein [Neolewinella lacunae]MBC6996812.1 acyl-CoA thioesterase [Neolewinella lacunae]MDN3637040.1 thioesterase family protein [Neolewinella lacunae]
MLSLSDFKITARYPTHWGDMDQARHINNLIYLRWAETIRVVYFEAMEMNTSFAPGGIGPILAWQDAKYIFPMTHPDTAVLGVRATAVSADRFTLETAIFSEQHQRIAAITQQIIVPYDYALLQKAPLPAAWVAAIEKLA